MAACNGAEKDVALSLVADEPLDAPPAKLLNETAHNALSGAMYDLPSFEALLQKHSLLITQNDIRQLFFAACARPSIAIACHLYIDHAVRFSHDEGGRLIDLDDYHLRRVLPVLQGLKVASKKAGMLAEYEEDLKMALSQTNDDGNTVLTKLLKKFRYYPPCLKLLEYILNRKLAPVLGDELGVTCFNTQGTTCAEATTVLVSRASHVLGTCEETNLKLVELLYKHNVQVDVEVKVEGVHHSFLSYAASLGQ